eukprot:6178833-Pleurochrysis_carterae.AAC.1
MPCLLVGPAEARVCAFSKTLIQNRRQRVQATIFIYPTLEKEDYGCVPPCTSSQNEGKQLNSGTKFFSPLVTLRHF